MNPIQSEQAVLSPPVPRLFLSLYCSNCGKTDADFDFCTRAGGERHQIPQKHSLHFIKIFMNETRSRRLRHHLCLRHILRRILVHLCRQETLETRRTIPPPSFQSGRATPQTLAQDELTQYDYHVSHMIMSNGQIHVKSMLYTASPITD